MSAPTTLVLIRKLVQILLGVSFVNATLDTIRRVKVSFLSKILLYVIFLLEKLVFFQHLSDFIPSSRAIRN